MGWPGGCLAACVARCATTALAGAVPCWCVCGAYGRLQGRGPCHFSSLPSPLAVPPSGPSRCSLRVAMSECPLFSPAGTPFLVVCALRVLGPFVLAVRAACSLCVCALTHPRWLHPPLSRCRFARALGKVPS